VIRLTFEKSERSVQLLHQNHTRQSMRQRHFAQRQRFSRLVPDAVVQAFVSPNHENHTLGLTLSGERASSTDDKLSPRSSNATNQSWGVTRSSNALASSSGVRRAGSSKRSIEV
jgi:hypothetical protein